MNKEEMKMKVEINLRKIEYMIIKGIDGKLHQIYNLGNGNYKVKVDKVKINEK